MSVPGSAELDFNPPSSYSFEPEFLGSLPRSIPDELDQGPHARRQQATVLGLATVGVSSLALRYVPGVDVLARYVLPLAYLGWIGVASLVLAAVALVERSRRSGPYRYVREGIPLVTRILELSKTPTAIVNGIPSTYALVAAVVLRHPETGAACVATLKSNDFAAGSKDRYDTPFRVGDHVTAVYLPGRFEKSLRLYAFLDLSPRLLLRRAEAEPESPLKLALLLAGLVALFLALFANVYAFGRYHPPAFDYWRAAVPMGLGGLVLGGGLLAGLYRAHQLEQEKAAKRAVAARAEGRAVEAAVPFLGTGLYKWFVATLLAAGAPLLGAATALCWCFMANAWLDTSAARPVAAKVESMTQTTHAFLFREYEIEISLQGFEGRQKLLTTPEQLAQFRSEAAVARVRAGRFGWAWIETVLPAP